MPNGDEGTEEAAEFSSSYGLGLIFLERVAPSDSHKSYECCGMWLLYRGEVNAAAEDIRQFQKKRAQRTPALFHSDLESTSFVRKPSHCGYSTQRRI